MSTPSDTLVQDRFAVMESTVRRLVFWNRACIVIIVLGTLVGAGWWAIKVVQNERDRLIVTVAVDGCEVFNYGERPYVVTAFWGYNKMDRAVVAALSPPLVIPAGDSGGRLFDATLVEHLKWTTWKDGHTASPPSMGSIRVLYYEPSVLPPE